jgi:hypothetical protein
LPCCILNIASIPGTLELPKKKKKKKKSLIRAAEDVKEEK